MRRFVLVVAAVLAVAAATPAAAQAPQTVGIRIIDVPTNRTDDPRAREYIVDHLGPGKTVTRRVEVSNDTGTAQVIQLYGGPASIDGGNLKFADRGTVSDLTNWTTVDPPTVSPGPGAKAVATVTIAVPVDASPGERYGVVWAELAPAVPPAGGVTAVNRVGVRIYLSVGPGGEPVSDFAITSFSATRTAEGSPQLAASVQNTGGRAVDLSGELRLTNGPAGLSAGPFAAKLGTTLGLGQTEPVLVPLDPALPPGPWDARIVLRSGMIQREATATVTFPEGPATAAAPVRTNSGSGGTPLLPVAFGGAALVGISGAGVVTARRVSIRRRTRSSW